MPDLFDPFGEYPDVVAVPVEEAIEAFRNHYGPELQERNRQLTAELKAGTSTVQSRRTQRAQQETETERVHLQLFRSLLR